jgi:hypothetical protein
MEAVRFFETSDSIYRLLASTSHMTAILKPVTVGIWNLPNHKQMKLAGSVWVFFLRNSPENKKESIQAHVEYICGFKYEF